MDFDDAIRTPPPIDPILAAVPLAEIRSFLWDFELPAVARPSPVPLVEVKPGENIQSRLDALAGGTGGTLRLKNGFHFLDEPIQLRANTVLEGEGPQTVLIPRRGKRISHIILTEGGVHDVIIRNLMIDGGRTTQERIEQAEPWPFGLFIVDGNGAESNARVLVSNVHIRRTAMGLHSKGTDDLILQNLYLEDNGWGPGGFYHNGYLRRNKRVLIRDSVFRDSHAANGLNLTLQHDILVSGNLFLGNKARGVRAAANTNLVIIDNVAIGNEDFGIGTRRELGEGVSGYIAANNHAVDNGVNFSLLFAENGWEFNNVESHPPSGE